MPAQCVFFWQALVSQLKRALVSSSRQTYNITHAPDAAFYQNAMPVSAGIAC